MKALTNFDRDDYPTYKRAIELFEFRYGERGRYTIDKFPMRGNYNPVPTDYSLVQNHGYDASIFWKVFEEVNKTLPTKMRRSLNPEKYKTLKENKTMKITETTPPPVPRTFSIDFTENELKMLGVIIGNTKPYEIKDLVENKDNSWRLENFKGITYDHSFIMSFYEKLTKAFKA